MDEENKNKGPLDTIRDRALKATIWENEGERGPYLSITFAKTIEDRDGNVRDVAGFSPDESLRLSELSRRAFNRAQDLRRDIAQERSQSPEPRERTDKSAPQERRRRYGRERSEQGAERRPARRSGPEQSY